MKKLLLLPLLISMAYAQDVYLSAKLVGPKMIEITNHNYAQMGVEMKAEGMLTMTPDLRGEYGFLYLPIGKTTIQYTGMVDKIELKATMFNIWMGEMAKWVVIPSSELNKAVTLKSISVNRLDSNTVKLTFEAQGQVNVKQYNIKLSRDGKQSSTHTVIIPNNFIENKQYTQIIKL